MAVGKVGYQPRREPGEDGGGETPEPPAAPMGLTFTQENPGDPLLVDGTLAPGGTLVKTTPPTSRKPSSSSSAVADIPAVLNGGVVAQRLMIEVVCE